MGIPLREIKGLGPKTEAYLHSQGIDTVEALIAAPKKTLLGAPRMSESRAREIMANAHELLQDTEMKDVGDVSSEQKRIFVYITHSTDGTSSIAFDNSGTEWFTSTVNKWMAETHKTEGEVRGLLTQVVYDCRDDDGYIDVDLVQDQMHEIWVNDEAISEVLKDDERPFDSDIEDPDKFGLSLFLGIIAVFIGIILGSAMEPPEKEYFYVLYFFGGMILGWLASLVHENLEYVPVIIAVTIGIYQYNAEGEAWYSKPWEIVSGSSSTDNRTKRGMFDTDTSIALLAPPGVTFKDLSGTNSANESANARTAKVPERSSRSVERAGNVRYEVVQSQSESIFYGVKGIKTEILQQRPFYIATLLNCGDPKYNGGRAIITKHKISLYKHTIPGYYVPKDSALHLTKNSAWASKERRNGTSISSFNKSVLYPEINRQQCKDIMDIGGVGK